MPTLVPPPGGYQEVSPGNTDDPADQSTPGLAVDPGINGIRQEDDNSAKGEAPDVQVAGMKRPGEAAAEGVPKKKPKGPKKLKGGQSAVDSAQ